MEAQISHDTPLPQDVSQAGMVIGRHGEVSSCPPSYCELPAGAVKERRMGRKYNLLSDTHHLYF